jgi:membrane protein DedA with SNARE-associated domain
VTGAAIWATVFAWAGYLFGTVIETYFEKEGKWVVMGVVITVAFVVWLVRNIRRRRARVANGEAAAAALALPAEPTEK